MGSGVGVASSSSPKASRSFERQSSAQAAGISAAPLEHHEVVETGKRDREQFARFVTGILTGI